MKYLLTISFSLILLLSSCIKGEGLGGNAVIEGKVYVLDYNQELTQQIGEYYGPDIDVYIIYGNDVVYSDDFKTSYDGTYRFDHLRPGNYSVFAYSEDTTGTNESVLFPVFKQVTITDKDELVHADDIIIVK